MNNNYAVVDEYIVYLQVELFMPHRVQLLGHGSRTLLDLSHLNRDVGIAGAALVFRYQALRAYHCGRDGGRRSTRYTR